MKNDHADGKDRPASYESPKIVVTHHPIEGQRMRIEQLAGSDDTETLAGHTAKVFYNYVEEHLPFPELPNFGVLPRSCA